ncbi:IclR family transcriptional regulator [Bordetella sp. 15P40C-2]|uniref:IclR family transcriptional regulator n=1 Tax=Bordetella sp. 15P40C-2 TaxID=2572246 RepID=UPI001329DFB5|nr:IclR family transcriptional regulator [Bordetella sp. 15P40C-2]MVW70684.1 helix-turn-helix domain-containing protein [Bordetella sp. 15P40C-2]
MARYPVRQPDPAQVADGGVTAVDRALAVLMAFREDDAGVTLRELSERVSLVPSTVLRLLASLIHAGFVQRDAEARYRLGPSAAHLNRVYAASFRLQDIVLPVLQTLVAQTRESASFHVRQGEQRLLLYRVNSPEPLSDQSRAGDLLPLDQGSGGHVLQAFSGATGDIYDRIRAEGYMSMPVSDRSADLAGISAPVFYPDRQLAGALTLTMPAHRFRKTHVPVLRRAAKSLTAALGGSPRVE